MSTQIGDVTTTNKAYSAADDMKKKLGMNKDDFLKLFVAQLQHQDPLAPQDPAAMLQQLSQLTLVEQSYNATNTLEKMLQAQSSSMSMGALSLIGMQVTANGNQIGFNGADPAAATYQTATALTGAKMTIVNGEGKIVRVVELGNVEAGTSTYQWDGKDGQGNLLPEGAYEYFVSGLDPLGNQREAATVTSGKADGVSFHNGEAYVSIGPVAIPFSAVVTVKAS